MMSIMTEPSEFFRPIHPSQSDYLVHFCGRRPGRSLPDVLQTTEQAPQERLTSIISEGRLRAFYAYGGTAPTVSFSECSIDAASNLLKSQMFSPWGLVVRKTWVWERGGGPVWYVRADAYDRVKAMLDPVDASFLVRTDPGKSDWFHQNEWRVPCEIEDGIALNALDLHAVIVADDQWTFPRRHEPCPAALGLRVAELEPGTDGVSRWVWNGVSLNEKPALPGAGIVGYYDL